MYLAYFVEFVLTWALSYLEAFNLVFGTRDILFIHYGISTLPFAAFMIIWNEGRKFCVIIILKFRSGLSSQRLPYQVGGIDA